MTPYYCQKCHCESCGNTFQKPHPDSFLRNCHLIVRDGDTDIFDVGRDGQGNDIVRARLDGYAVVPKETYDELAALRDTSLQVRLRSAAEARIKELETALREIGAQEKDARYMVENGFHNTTLAIDLCGKANAAIGPKD